MSGEHGARLADGGQPGAEVWRIGSELGEPHLCRDDRGRGHGARKPVDERRMVTPGSADEDGLGIQQGRDGADGGGERPDDPVPGPTVGCRPAVQGRADDVEIQGQAVGSSQPELDERLDQTHGASLGTHGQQMGDLAGETATTVCDPPSGHHRAAQTGSEEDVDEVVQTELRFAELGPDAPHLGARLAAVREARAVLTGQA